MFHAGRQVVHASDHWLVGAPRGEMVNLGFGGSALFDPFTARATRIPPKV